MLTGHGPDLGFQTFEVIDTAHLADAARCRASGIVCNDSSVEAYRVTGNTKGGHTVRKQEQRVPLRECV